MNIKTRLAVWLGIVVAMGTLSFVSVSLQEANHYREQTAFCQHLNEQGKRCAWKDELGPGDHYDVEVKK